jgi:hypothetical protein
MDRGHEKALRRVVDPSRVRLLRSFDRTRPATWTCPTRTTAARRDSTRCWP